MKLEKVKSLLNKCEKCVDTSDIGWYYVQAFKGTWVRNGL